MRTLFSVAILVVLLTACGGSSEDQAGAASVGSDEPIAAADVDQEAWKADIVAAGARANPDMERLYDLAVDDCKTTTEDLSLRFTISGSVPEITRIGMEYVCPSEAGRVDDALTANQEVMSELDAACSLAPEQRTEDQQDMVEAVGC